MKKITFILCVLSTLFISNITFSQSSFSSGVVGNGNGSAWNYNSIAEHPVTGDLYAMWRDGSGTAAVYKLLRWTGTAWTQVGSYNMSAVFSATTFDSASDDVSLAIGSTGTFHVAFRGSDNRGGCCTQPRGIVYAYSTNGTSWSFERVSSYSSSGGSRNVDDPIIRVSSTGIVHIGAQFTISENPVSYAGQSYNRLYTVIHHRRDAANTWVTSYPYFQGGSSNEVGDLSMALDTSGNPHFAWMAEVDGTGRDGTLMYTVYTGTGSQTANAANGRDAGWAAPTSIITGATTAGEGRNNDIEIDPTDNSVHIMSYGPSGIRYSTKSTGSFSTGSISGISSDDFIQQNFFNILSDGTKCLFFIDYNPTTFVSSYKTAVQKSGSSWTISSGSHTPTSGGSFPSSFIASDGTAMVLYNGPNVSGGGDRQLFYATGTNTSLVPTNSSPTNISLSSSSINQSATGANANVGNLSTTDADSGDTHTYTLVSGTGSTNNGSFNISGATLRTSTALTPGNYSVRINTNDGTANFAKQFSITIVDNVAPSSPSTPDLAAASDSGSSNSDNITNDNTPTFNGTAEANATVTVISSVDGTLGTTTANGSGNWTYTSGTLSQGSHSITATARDAANNTSSASSALSIVIDTAAPSSPSTPDLAASSDIGSSNSDNITNDNTPTFNGTAEANATVTVISSVDGTLGTTTTNGSGNWTYTSGSLSQGSHNITATATDAANNTSSASSALSIVIDTAAPVFSAVNPASGSNVSNSNVGYALSEALASGTVSFTRTSGSPDASSPHNVNLSGSELNAGTRALSSLTNAPTLVSGTVYTISFNGQDTAGNSASTVNATSITFDITPPTVSSVSLASDNSFIDVTFTEGVFDTNGGSGALEVTDFDLSISGGTATSPSITSVTTTGGGGLSGGETTVRVNFSYTGTPDGSETLEIDLADGSSVFDALGNAASANQTSNNTASLNDETPPSDPTVTTPSTAVVINAASQSISGTHSENGVTVYAYADANNDGVADNTTSLGSATVSGNAWSFSVNLTADSANNFVVQAEDAAGNTSNDIDVATITEDSTSPADPVVTSPTTVIYVNAASQTISGTHSENGVTIHAFADANNDGVADNTTSLGSSIVSGNAWSFSVNLTADSANNFVVKAEDAAGNTSNDEDVPVITEDSTNPLVQLLSPTDDASNVLFGQNISITFNETIAVGTGNITIFETGVGVFEQFNVATASEVTFNANVITINPAGLLKKGTNYHVEVDNTAVTDLAGNSYAGINDATTYNFTTVDVVINEVVTNPQQDWSANNFNGVVGTGTVSDVDEWVELFINSTGIDFTGWSLEIDDGVQVTGDLEQNGTFVISNYITMGSGVFTNSEAGDFIVLGNVTGSGTVAMNNDVEITLKDPDGTIVDQVQLGGGAGEAPTGNASSIADESVQRSPNGTDTDDDSADFVRAGATLGLENDATPPSFENSTPSASSILQTTLTLNTDIDESGTIYYVVLADGATAPTAIQVQSGTDASNNAAITSGNQAVSAASFTHDFSILGLVAETAYDVYVVANDSYGNIQTSPTKVDITTLAEPNVSLSQSDATFAEAAGTNTITATLSSLSDQDVTIGIAVKSGGQATLTNDFSLSTTSIVIPTGNTTGTATLTAVQDILDEDNEDITIEITSVTNGSENGTQEVTSTITDDDTPPTISFSTATSKGLESVASANTQIDINAVSGRDVTVDYTVTGTATEGVDFTLANGTITINEGDTNTNLTIASIIDDVLVEADETVIITLSSPTNATLGTNSSHTYTIENNDETIVTIADISQQEDGTFTLTATATNAVDGGFSIGISTVNGTAAAPADFTALSGTTLNFTGTAGETQTVEVIVVDDGIVEADEVFQINMSNVVATTVATSSVDITDTASVTIENNDTTTVTIADVNGNEDDGAITLTATLGAAVQGGFSFDVVSADGTATLADSDYTTLLQTINFAGTAGETQTFTVIPTVDVKAEFDEDLTVSMTRLNSGVVNAANIDVTDTATVTIVNDDSVNISIADQMVVEGNTGNSNMDFTVTLDKPAPTAVTVNYATSDNTANSGSDYNATTGILTFNAGETSGTITVPITGDLMLEADETFTVTLSSPSAFGIIVDGTAIGTIQNNDVAAVTLTNKSGAEDAGGILVTARLDNPVQGGFTVNARTAEGTARTLDNDFTQLSGVVLTFAGTAGEEQTFTITPTADTKVEATEVLTARLGNLSGTSLAVNTSSAAQVYITNDDTATVTIEDVVVNEGDGDITVTATLDNAVEGGFSVDVNVQDGSASSTTDYQPIATQTLTFVGNEGETQNVVIKIVDDTSAEPSENINVSLSNVDNTIFEDFITATDSGTVTIIDNDSPAITQVQVPTSGNYGIGSVLEITLTYATNISITGSPVIPIQIGAATVNATLSEPVTNTNVAKFTYIVEEGDLDADGIEIAAAISLNGATIVSSSNLLAAALSINATNTANILVDGIRPTASLTTASSGIINTSFDITVTFDEVVTGFTVEDLAINNGTASNFTGSGTSYSATITPTTDGEVTVSLPENSADDVASNGNITSNQIRIPYDNTSPEIPVVVSPEATIYTNADTHIISGTHNENGVVVHAYLDADNDGVADTTTSLASATVANNSWSIEINLTQDAENNFVVIAIDEATNKSNAVDVPTIIEDSTPPAAPVLPNAVTALTTNYDYTELVQYQGESATLFVFSSGNSSTALLEIPNITMFDSELPIGQVYQSNGVQDGQSVALDYVMQDAAGNRSEVITGPLVTIDTSNPEPTLTSTVDNPTNEGFEVTITFDEPVTDFEATDITVTNGTLSNFTNITAGLSWTVAITPTNDGQVTVIIPQGIATDNAGNSNTASNTFGLVYDATSPVPTIATTANSPLNTTFNVSITFSEAVVNFTEDDVLVTNGTLGTLSSSDNIVFTGTVTPQADGPLFIDVIEGATTDAAGNPNAEANLEVQVDLTPPNAPVITGVSEVGCSDGQNITADNTLLIFGTAEAGATVEVFVNNSSVGTTQTDTQGNFTFDNTANILADGLVSITAIATDVLGNQSSVSSAFSITIDTLDTDGDGIPDVCDDDYDGNGVTDTEEDCDGDGIVDSLDSDVSSCSNIIKETKSYGFSPNGDGVNDGWTIKNIELYPNNRVSVYNRSGKLVFRQRSYQNTWDGVSNQATGGARLPVGPYVFVIDLGDGTELVRGWLYINY